MISSSLAFTVNQAKYGKGEHNIEICGIEVCKNFFHQAYPQGAEKEVNLDVLEKYGLAVNFARILHGNEEFVLSVPRHSSSFGKVYNVFSGNIPDLPLTPAKIVVDSSTVRFLAEGFNSFLSLKDGYPTAAARVVESYEDRRIIYKIFFCEKVIPVP